MPEARILESAVDWITVTTRDTKKAAAMAAWGHDWFVDEVDRDNKPSVFSLYGYEGAHAGAVSYGTRHDGAILQISGAAAAEHFNAAVALGDNITRLDLQVTVRTTPFDQWLASSYYVNRPATGNGKGRIPTYRYWEASTGGSTLYVGSVSSEQMGRLYNKAAESGDKRYASCWRYEMQLRGRASTTTGRSLAKLPTQGAAITGLVWWWFRNRGVVPGFDEHGGGGLELPPRPKSDVAQKLEWLNKAVRPTCAYLMEIDRCEDMLLALGLSSSLDPLSVPFSEVGEGAAITLPLRESLNV